MTRGQAQNAANAIVAEAERIPAEAASAARVDAYRRAFDAAVEDHCLRFGFDTSGELL